MKNFFKFIGIVFVGGVLIVGWNNSARGETLQDAIKYMLQTNPEIKTISYNRLARDQEVTQAKSGYFPTLDVSYGVGRDWQRKPFHDTSWPKSTVLSLRQNVFQFGVTKGEVNRQKARVRSEAYLLQGTSENIALQASKVYLNVLRNLELHELAKENLTNHERIYDQMNLRRESGVDSKADLDQVMGRLALAQNNIVVTNANIVDAKTDYQFVVGRLPEDLIKPQTMSSSIPASLEEAEQLAVKNHPILKSAQADLEAREEQHRVAKRICFPSFDISADYRWQDDVNDNNGFNGYQEEFIAMGMVSFNIFKGWRDKGRICETMYLISEAQEIFNSTQREVVQSIGLSWEAYKAAQDRVTHLEEYVKSSQLTAEAFAKQWSIGRRTMFDVLDTQAEYINACSDLVKAQYDKMYAECRILSGMGELTHTLSLQWPEESSVVETVKKDAS